MNPSKIYKKEGEAVAAGDTLMDVESNGKTIPVKAQKSGVMQPVVYGKGGEVGNIPRGGSPIDPDEEKKRREASSKYKGPEVARNAAV